MRTNIFNFRKCPFWSVNENQFERQKLCLHIRASKDHRRNNTESATGQNNIKEILNFIKNNKDLLKSISYTRKKQELEKILTSKNAVKGLNYLKELELLDELEIKYDKIVNVSDILGMWAQMEFSLKYQFTKQSLTIINQIKEIVSYGKIDSYVLLKYGLYVSLVAGEILGYSREDINKMDKQMPIHKISDVKINNNDIMNLLGIDGSPKLRVIYDDIVDEILKGKVKNNKRDIKKYIIKKWM